MLEVSSARSKKYLCDTQDRDGSSTRIRGVKCLKRQGGPS